MLDHGLSVQQLAVICALSSGATRLDAAQQAGVHRNTISNWRRNLLPFQHALADAQYDRALHFREKVEDLVDLAIKTIQDILANPEAPMSGRLKAALAVIGTASTPPPPKKQVELDIQRIAVTPQQSAQSASSPANSPSPLHNAAQPPNPPTKQVDLDIHGIAVTAPPSAQSTSSEIAVNPRSSAANSPSPLHNHAQLSPAEPPDTPKTVQPDPPEICGNSHTFAAKVPRNHACPCGSGKKYKRCCLGHPRAAAA